MHRRAGQKFAASLAKSLEAILENTSECKAVLKGRVYSTSIPAFRDFSSLKKVRLVLHSVHASTQTAHTEAKSAT